MTYRELQMMDVREMLRRCAAGHSIRKTARETGCDRKTVERYVTAARKLKLSAETTLSDEIVHAVAKEVQTRRPADPSIERAEVAQHEARIKAWLERARPLKLTKIHALLVRDHGLQASYYTVRRYAIDELGWHKTKPTVLVADGKPGEEAQIDFGTMGMIHDAEGQQMRRLYVLVVTLVVSRYQFVWATFNQTTQAVCNGLDAAWRFFGAMVRVLVPDNMSAIVALANPLNPTIVPAFQDYLTERGLFVDPARVRSPRDKGRVENQVAFIRESWFDGEEFHGIDDAQRSAERWCREIAGMRVHGTTKQVPHTVFERDEKPHMLPAPTSTFDVPKWATAKVHPDHHVKMDGALYSLPTHLIGQTVRVRADATSVRIYLGTEHVKMHPRVAKGERSTDPGDYPSGTDTFALRKIDGLLEKTRSKGANIGMFAQKLLEGPLPWARTRQVYALMKLCETFGEGRVEAVCQSALGFDVVDVQRIERMLRKAISPTASESTATNKVVQLKPPRFARSTEHFQTVTGTKEAT